MKVKIKLQIFVLLLIVMVGIWLRLRQWNDYMIYPDSYHYLVSSYDMLICGKLLYCNIVNIVLGIFTDPALVLRIISLVCSAVSIVIIYALFENTFKRSGLIVSLLYASSFSIISWTNFVLPDQIAVLLLLLFLLFRERLFSVVLLFCAALVRPEYIFLLLIAPFTVLVSKRLRALSLSCFLVGLVYYYLAGSVFPPVFIFKESTPLIINKLLLYEIAIVYSAVIGFILRARKFGSIDWFFLIQLIVFVLIYLWQNPLNWRYSVHLIVPLVYFSSWYVKYLVDGINRSKPLTNYLATVGVVIMFVQLVISYHGVQSQIPTGNYEKAVVKKADDITSMLGIQTGRYATYFDKVVLYEVSHNAVNPLKTEIKQGDILIYDTALGEAGFKVSQDSHLEELARYKINRYFYFGHKRMFPGEVVLYLVKDPILE